MWVWRVLRARPTLFHWPKLLSFILFSPVFPFSSFFLYALVLYGWGHRTDRMSIAFFWMALHCRPFIIKIIIIKVKFEGFCPTIRQKNLWQMYSTADEQHSRCTAQQMYSTADVQHSRPLFFKLRTPFQYEWKTTSLISIALKIMEFVLKCYPELLKIMNNKNEIKQRNRWRRQAKMSELGENHRKESNFEDLTNRSRLPTETIRYILTA